jgi:hypothetical protein
MKNLPDFSNMDIYTSNSGVGCYPTPDNFLQKLLDIKAEYEIKSPNIKSTFARIDYNREDTLNIKQSADGEIESELIKHNTYSHHQDKNYVSDYYKTYEYREPIYGVNTSHMVKIRNCE